MAPPVGWAGAAPAAEGAEEGGGAVIGDVGWAASGAGAGAAWGQRGGDQRVAGRGRRRRRMC